MEHPGSSFRLLLRSRVAGLYLGGEGGLMSCFTVSAWWENDFLQYFSFSCRVYTALFLSSKSKIL